MLQAKYVGYVLLFSGFLLSTSCRSTKRLRKAKSYSYATGVTDLPNLSAAAPKAGRYMGYINVKDKKLSYPVVIDLISYRQNKEFYKFRSVVKVLNETYGSNEYSAAYFPHVDFKGKDKSLFFKSKDEIFDLHEVALFGDVLKGKIKFANTSIEGSFFASWQSAMESKTSFQDMLVEFPIVPNITGAYRGVCQGNKTEIQLEVHRRSRLEKDQLLTPFDWKIVGRLGYLEPGDCKSGSCEDVAFLDGSYDFPKSRIELKTDKYVKECFLQEDGLNCDGCSFKSIGESKNSLAFNRKYKVYEREYTVNYSKTESQNTKPLASKVSGEYYGYLHHETLDRYQLLRLNIENSTKKNSAGKNWNFIHGSASLFFGDSNFKEFIAYQFKPRRYVKSRPVFMFDGDGESFFVVTRWMKGGLEGIWYSKNFGRVGSLQLTKNRLPKILKDVPFISPIGGKYSGPGGAFQLAAKADLSDTAKSFYPLQIYGWAVDRRQNNRRLVVTGGFYDFYTGMVSLTLDDKRMVLGTIDGRDAQVFLPPGIKAGISMGRHRASMFSGKELQDTAFEPGSSMNKALINSTIGKNILAPGAGKGSYPSSAIQ